MRSKPRPLHRLLAVVILSLATISGIPAQQCGDCNSDGSCTIFDALLVYQALTGLPVTLSPCCEFDGLPGIGLCDVVKVSTASCGACPCLVPGLPCTPVAAALLTIQPPPLTPVGGTAIVTVVFDGGTVVALRGTLAYDPARLRLLSIHHLGNLASVGMGSPQPFWLIEPQSTATRLELQIEFEVLAAGCSSVTVDIQEAIDPACCNHATGTLVTTVNCSCGDCNLDGTPGTIVDALTAAQIAVGLVQPTAEQQQSCDVDASLAIDTLDALRMARASAGLVVMLSCP